MVMDVQDTVKNLEAFLQPNRYRKVFEVCGFIWETVVLND